ncbi:MAG: acyl-CoA dehydrogenase [Bdellovibrionales bacterium RIFOXYA1_FULL_36_14]|nr:MAG: acyl-CoA dehydrogenase [Bdellovibrionales bacterium RIFOXYA1_FULL_36_14]
MSNFYNDNQDIIFHMENMDLRRIVELKEDNFTDSKTCRYSPLDYEDTRDNYKKLLEIMGDITGNYIAPRATEVDQLGATYKDGEVAYAQGTKEAIDILKKADLMGMTLPRKYEGLNLPKTIYSMCIEMVSRADASLMNLVGLQDIADTICKFGSEDQKARYLPRFARGEVMGAMALTEPDAGSDLQAVMLKATQNPDGNWYLNGVKRFITNGCADVSLVLARSEDKTTDGRGLSLFVYERDKNMTIRRIEHKLGIHGSPTCEIQFNNARCELLGTRRMGLIKYTMSLMNGARLGIAAQSLGIAEAAYREALKYAKERNQFKKKILNFTAVYEMLTDMKIGLEASRTLLYETSKIVDIKEGLEERMEKYPERKSDLRDEISKYTKLAGLFTPLAKAHNAEIGNKICYDAIQIHGGVGYTTEFSVERHARDQRITNIYEGTTQMQIVAAIGGITSGLVSERLNEYENDNDFTKMPDLFKSLQELRTNLELAVSHIKKRNDNLSIEFHARRLTEMALYTVNSYLLSIAGLKNDRKKQIAKIYTSKALPDSRSRLEFISSNDYSIVELHEGIINH